MFPADRIASRLLGSMLASCSRMRALSASLMLFIWAMAACIICGSMLPICARMASICHKGTTAWIPRPQFPTRPSGAFRFLAWAFPDALRATEPDTETQPHG